MNSIDEVAEALNEGDYRGAARLLKALVKESPENPWVQLYVARLYEETDKLEAAEKVYRKLLRQARNPKVVGQARQGLKRVETIPKERRKEAIARATANPDRRQLGVLVLEPIADELKTEAARRFARIMQLEPYSARLLLPSRSWRMYRTGAIGELRVFVEELRQAEIPCFCATVEQINQIPIFQVKYFQAISPKASVVCKNSSNQLGKLAFDWSEVTDIVTALMPIFKEVAVQNHRRTRTNYKEKTSDYIGICDLHLQNRGCILRLCQETYQFQEGVAFTPVLDKAFSGSNVKIDSLSVNLRWQTLLKFLKEKLVLAQVRSDFNFFAETVLPESNMLEYIDSQIEFWRYAPSNWDPAFQLYSGLILLRESL